MNSDPEKAKRDMAWRRVRLGTGSPGIAKGAEDLHRYLSGMSEDELGNGDILPVTSFSSNSQQADSFAKENDKRNCGITEGSEDRSTGISGDDLGNGEIMTSFSADSEQANSLVKESDMWNRNPATSSNAETFVTKSKHDACARSEEDLDICGLGGTEKCRNGQSNLVVNKTTMHTEETPYKCQVCDKEFSQSFELKIHELELGHIAAKPHQCYICGKAFTKRQSCVVHERKHRDKTYQCELCEKTFRKSYLAIHQRTHTGEKPYTCNICGKAFGYSTTLAQHEWKHTGKKPYQCTICGSSFSHRSGLSQHEWTHTGKKPYQCSTCGKTFGRKPYLVEHQRTHTGEKPLICDFCGEAFRHRASFVRHRQTHTEDDTQL